MYLIEFIKNLHINLIYIIVAFIGLAGMIGIAIWRRLYTKKDARIVRGFEKTEATDRKLSDARKEFVTVFDEARERLNSKGSEASAILSQTMERHRVAYEKFSRILERLKGSGTVTGLDEKWKEYYDTETYGKNPFAKYNNRKPGTKEGEQEARNCAIKKIETILNFIDDL